MGCPFHVGPEHKPAAVGRKGRIGFQPIVMRAQVNDLLNIQASRHDQIIAVGGTDASYVRNRTGREAVEIFAIRRTGHHLTVAAVA